MLWRLRAPGNFVPNAMRAPAVDLLERSNPGRSARRADLARPILDPRDGDAEDDASSPKQKSLLAIAGSLLAEISLTKLVLAWIGVDRASGGDPRPRAAGRDGMGRRRLVQSRSNCTASARRSCCSPSPAWAGSAGGRCFGRRRRISGRSTRSRSSRDTPCAAKRSGISPSEPSGRSGGAELARMRAMSCAGAGLLLAASRRWSRSPFGRPRDGSDRRQTSRAAASA